MSIDNVGRVIDTEVASVASRVVRDPRGAYRIEPRERKLQHLEAMKAAIPRDADDETVDRALERIIGENDLLNSSWFGQGRRAARAVALISTGWGDATGFMISPELIMTNWHVLNDAAHAADPSVKVLYGYQNNDDGVRDRLGEVELPLDPDTFFAADERLDYAIVAVGATPDGAPLDQTFGHLPLNGAPSKAIAGSALNIIQHPGGQLKKIAIRNNIATVVKADDLIVYLTDTNPGSSGSPVLNDNWQVVALHHSSQDATDAAGNRIDINGNPVTDRTPEYLRYWVANEGIRISSIVKHLLSRSFTPAEQQLIRNAVI
jgi:endonuclease G, mitochondrial